MIVTPENMAELLVGIAEQVERLSKIVETPDSGLVDRLLVAETDVSALSETNNTEGDAVGPIYHKPDNKTEPLPIEKSFGGEILPFQIEYGKPTANVTTDVATVTLQPCDVSGTSYAKTGTVTGVKDNGTTTVTATTPIFYPSIVGKDVVITDTGTFAVASYTSATEVVVTGDATCEAKAIAFDNASTVAVYIANDRQTQATAYRGWTTATILSFVRFTAWKAGTPNIEGVLVGEANLTGFNSVPSGVIAMWGGAIVDIPTGWSLCDGTNDGNDVATPDLSGKFIVGYDSSDAEYDAIGDSGGFKLHGPTENEHAKFRTYTTTSGDNNWAYWDRNQTDPFAAVDTDNRPPFYTLAFIRKD